MADRKDLGKRAEIAKAADIAVLCLPDAAAKELVAALGDADTVVIDASTAHRVADGWTYGFPELAKDQRQKLLDSNRISNPGCYPTGAIALLRPLVDAGIVRADSTPAVFGVSGYTGGGKELIAVHEQPGVEPFGLYGLELTHKHVPEMKKYSGLKHAPLFVPSVGHYAQGMLIIVPITRDITTKQVDGQGRARQCWPTTMPARHSCRCGRSPTAAWLERDRFLRADRLIDTNTMELAVYGNEAEEQTSWPWPRSTISARARRARRCSASTSRPASTRRRASRSPDDEPRDADAAARRGVGCRCRARARARRLRQMGAA